MEDPSLDENEIEDDDYGDGKDGEKQVKNGQDFNDDEIEYNYEMQEEFAAQFNKIELGDDQASVGEPIDDMNENDRIHASINEYKLKYLGSVSKMNVFKKFLQGTSDGEKLIKFWLDCEFFKDSMQGYDQIENMATRNRLFRDIIEKYIFVFSDVVDRKLKDDYLNSRGLNHQVFMRIQYDILRRLRSYWVPRFILNRLREEGKDLARFPLPPLTPPSVRFPLSSTGSTASRRRS
jgi:hypothetical protein